MYQSRLSRKHLTLLIGHLGVPILLGMSHILITIFYNILLGIGIYICISKKCNRYEIFFTIFEKKFQTKESTITKTQGSEKFTKKNCPLTLGRWLLFR